MFSVMDHQLIDEQVAPFIQSELENYREHVVYFSHPYLSLALDIDYFDLEKHQEMQHLQYQEPEVNSLIIWDNWFSPTEGNMDLNSLIEHPNYEMKASFKRTVESGEISFVIFEVH